LRSSREVRLTAAGERFVDYAQRLLALSEEAQRVVHGMAAQRTLQLGVVEDVAAFALAEILQGLAVAAPDLRLELHSASTRELLPHLGYRFDSVLGMARPEQRGGHELLKLPLCWLGEWRQGRVPLAVHPLGCGMRQMAYAALEQAGLPWETVIVAGGISANLAAVRAGLAMTVLADRLSPADLPRCTALPSLPPISIRMYADEKADAEAVSMVEQVAREVLHTALHA
jgi:DNA-binding transcriptional LysR family regulator